MKTYCAAHYGDRHEIGEHFAQEMTRVKNHKSKLVVVGDHILIEPDEGEEKTAVGLYVPRWVVEKESVQ